MTLPAHWQPDNTSALLAEGLLAANNFVLWRRQMAALAKMLTDNEINIGDLIDDPGYAMTKAEFSDLMNFRGNVELLCENGAPEQGFWGPKIGKIVTVLVG